MNDDQVDHSRRHLLTAATAGIGAVGVVFAAVPFIASWRPSERAKALGAGARVVVCASTGNTAASAAAYAARAGLKAFVLIPKGAVALGKLSQSVMHAARVLEPGDVGFDEDSAAAGALDALDGFGAAGFVEIGDYDRGAFFRESLRRCTPDAR